MEYEEEKLTEALVLARTRAPDLESVKKLNFWGSDISNIRIVREMPNLEVCSLSVNSISTLEDFSYCQNLQELYIRKNKIKDLSEINHLTKLPRLRNLWLADNHCADTENYRSKVLKTLPNLQKLDNVVVTEKELPSAAELELLTNDPEVTGTEITGMVDEDTEVTGTDITGTVDENKETTEEKEIPGANAVDPDELVGDSSHLGLNGTEDDEPIPSTPEVKDSMKTPHTSMPLDPVTMTWEETNKIRQEVGLKPLPFEKITSPKPVPNSLTARNAHVLQAVLILIRELDKDSLETVEHAIRRRLHPPS